MTHTHLTPCPVAISHCTKLGPLEDGHTVKLEGDNQRKKTGGGICCYLCLVLDNESMCLQASSIHADVHTCSMSLCNKRDSTQRHHLSAVVQHNSMVPCSLENIGFSSELVHVMSV